MKKLKPILGILFSAALLSACAPDQDESRLVGLLESDRIEITAETSEPIVNRLVVEGESVVAGQSLIQQDGARAETRIEEADAILQQTLARQDELIRGPRREKIRAAESSVRGAEKELSFRQTDLARAEEVFTRQLASPDVRDRAVVARDTAQANVESLQAGLDEVLTGTTAEELRQAAAAVRQAEARLQSVRIDLARHTTYAHEDGVVDTLLFEIGERPQPGQPVAILLSGQQAYARVYVPESIRVRVSPGTQARVYVDGLSEPLSGRVRWIATEAAFTPYFALTERDRGRLSFAAKIDVLDAHTRLPDGVPVEVELLLGSSND